MTTSILNKKKATKTAKVKNETLLRAKTMQRAAILFKQVSDPTRLQVILEELQRLTKALTKKRIWLRH